MQRIHRNLRGFNNDIKDVFIADKSKNSITLKYNNKNYKFNVQGIWNLGVVSEEQRNAIAETFRQLTYIDIKDDVLLSNSN